MHRTIHIRFNKTTLRELMNAEQKIAEQKNAELMFEANSQTYVPHFLSHDSHSQSFIPYFILFPGRSQSLIPHYWKISKRFAFLNFLI